MPSTSAEGAAVLKAISAKVKADPHVPVEFNDRGASVVVMTLPEPYVVQRGAGEKFTESAKKTDTPTASETVVNTNLYESTTTIPGGFSGPADLSDYKAQGQVVQGGKVVAGRSSPDTFHVAWMRGTNTWQFGKGDPPKGADVAFGGAIPVVVNGLPFGAENKFAPGAPSGLPTKGDPGPGNEKLLLQRSNAGFAAQEGKGAQLGKVVIGINREANLLVIVVEQHGASPGLNLSDIRNSFMQMGIKDAVAWDGSDSATLVRDSVTVSSPGRIKDNTIPVGMGFRVK